MSKKTYTPEEIKSLKASLEESKREQQEAIIRGELQPSIFGSYSSTYARPPLDWEELGYGPAARRGNWDNYALYDNPAYKAFVEQTPGQLAWDVLAGGSKRAVAGFMDMIGGYDLAEMSDLATNKGIEEAGNWAQQISKEFQEDTQRDNPIYTYGDSMWNLPYWANQAQNVGYSVGIMGEMIAEQGLLTLATIGSGGATAELQLAGLANKVRNFGRIKSLVTQGLMGLSGGAREAYVNARETLDSTYQDLLHKGYTEEEALKYAQEAAHIGFKAELGPLVAINTLQNIALFGKYRVPTSAFKGTEGVHIRTGFSDAVTQSLEKLVPQTKYKWLNKAVNFSIINPLAEGTEEVIQNTASKYGRYKSLEGTEGEEDLNLFDVETRDNFIGGVLGGFVLGGMAGTLNKVTQSAKNKQYYQNLEKDYDKFINESSTRTMSILQERQGALEELQRVGKRTEENPNDPRVREDLQKAIHRYKRAEENSTLSNTLQALQLDYLRGKGTGAFNATVGEMQGILNAVKGNDLTSLQKYGILDEKGNERFEGSLEMIERDFQDKIDDSMFIKDSLERNLLNITSDFQSAFNITQREYYNHSASKDIANRNSDIQSAYQSSPSFNSLSSDAKNRYQLENELYAYNQIERNADLGIAAPLSDIDKQRMAEIEQELGNLPGYSSQDRLNINNIPESTRKNIIDGHYSNISVGQSIIENNKKVKNLSDPNYIKEQIRKRKQKEIDQAKTVGETREALQEAENAGVATEEMRSKVEEKVAKEEIKENLGEEIKENTPVQSEPQPRAKVEEKSKEEQADTNALWKSILSQQKSLPPDAFDNPQVVDDQYLSPRRRNTVPVGDDVRAHANSVNNRLDNELGREATLQDFIEDFIQQKTFKEADDIYNFLVDAFASTGRDVSNRDQIYNNLFGGTDGLSGLANTYLEPSTQEEVQQANKEVEYTAQQVTSKKAKFNPNNIPQQEDIDTPDRTGIDRRTAIPDLKAAFNLLDTRRVDDITWKVMSRGLTQDSIIDNHYILDSVFIQDLIDRQVPLNVSTLDMDDVPMTEYLSDGTFLSTDWGKYKTKHNLKPGDSRWINKVPMVVSYIQSQDTDPIPLFMIHESSWYNERNISDRDGIEAQQEVIEDGFNRVSELRKAIYSGQNNIVISSSNFGSLDNLEQHQDSTPVSIQEAAQDSSTIGIIKYEKGKPVIFTAQGKRFTGNINGGEALLQQVDSTGNSLYQTGHVVDIRWAFNNSEGQPVYQVLRTMNNSPIANEGNLRADLDLQLVNNGKYAILTAILLNNSNNALLRRALESDYNFTLDKAEKLKAQIEKQTGISLTSNLNDYLSLFLQIGQTNSNLQETITNTSNRTGMTYLSNKYYDRSSQNWRSSAKVISLYNKTSDVFTQAEQINLGGTVAATVDAIEKLSIDLNKVFDNETGIFKKQQFSVSTTFLGREDISISNISDSGDIIQDSSRPLTQFIRENLRTNILSHEITTIDGESKMILDVQPMIYFKSISEANAQPISQTNQAVVDTANKAAQQTIKEIEVKQSQTQISDIEQAMSTMTEEEREMFKNFLNRDDNKNTFNSRYRLTEEQQSRIELIDTNKVTGLSSIQQKELVSSLKNKIISDINFTEKIKVGEIKSRLTNSVDNYIQPIIDTKRSIISKISSFESLAGKVKEMEEQIQLLENIVNEQGKLVSTRRDSLGSLTKEFNRLFNINFEEETIEDEGSIDDVFSKSFLEKELKLSYSLELRLALFGIPQLDKNKNTKTNFTELPQYNNADDVNLALLDITSDIPSNWDLFISKLDDLAAQRDNPLYTQLRNKLNILPQHLKNEFLYKNISKKLTVYKIINSPQFATVDGKQIVTGYRLQTFDENSTKEDIRWNTHIKDQFITSNFGIRDSEADIILNTQYAENIQKALQRYITTGTKPTFEQTKKIFENVGLADFSDNTIEEYLKYNNPVEKNTGILWFINKNLASLIQKDKDKKTGEKVLLEDRANNLFHNANTALNTLIDTEIMLNGSHVARSIRVNGKTMQGVIANTSMYDTIQDLKETNNSELFRALRANELTKGNNILYLLENDDKFRNAFQAAFSSPDSYKVNGKNNYGHTDFDKISKQDNLATTFALYTNTRGNVSLSNSKYRKGLEFRIGQMTTPTLSDKGRMVYLTTALMDFKGENISFDSEGNISLNDFVLDFMTEQLFDSELNRIMDSYNQPLRGIQNYDAASKLFLALPSFNTIEYKGKNIHAYLPNLQETTGEFRSAVREEAKRKIAEYINSEVNSKVSANGREGEFVESGMYDPNIQNEAKEGISVRNIDTEYLDSKPGKNRLEKLRYVTAEYVANNILNLNNIHQLFLGDIAFYSKDKAIFSSIFTDGKVDPEKVSNPEIYGPVLESIGVIVDKRAASLIAPGLKLSNSENPLYKESQDFIHIAINDVEGMSNSIKELIIAQYGELTEVEEELYNKIVSINDQIQKLNESDNIDSSRLNSLLNERKIYAKQLEQSNPDIADYFNITGTDAQEYTTWKAHIDTLYRQGNLTDTEKSQLESAYNKLSRGEEVSNEELQTLMQPVKPVYTGLVPEGDFVRPVYIKSSAFPLLPQLTKNLKIDEVRKKLESLEETNGRVVRMSYQSANKIGAKKSNLTMDDLYYRDLGTISGLVDSSMSFLPMKNFKIQQETPSKEDKNYHKGKDSYIRMGSQFWKIILGNGINHIDSNIFPAELFSKDLLNQLDIKSENGRISGVDLDKIYTNVYSEYSDLQMQALYDELGLSSTTDFYRLSDNRKNQVMRNLTKIIREEIISRGYPDYLEDSIGLVNEGNLEQMLMPLIFDPNSNKFEALLQSIISSRLITHYLPGNSHISASSEGFERKTTLDVISEQDRAGIVWIGDREAGPLKATINSETGQIEASEVLIRSHYKVRDENGDLKYIDLSSDEYSEPILDSEGNITGRRLLEDKIDQELLENFSFRIPTSSHQSGVILKVVGFLPQASADLILVPKEHTTQLGEDYDIDKRYIYKSNYYVNREGVVKKLQQEDIRKDLEAIEAILQQEDLTTDKLVASITGTNLTEDALEALNELRELGLRATSDDVSRIGRKTINEIRTKMLENSIIDVYKSVYKSTNTDIQRKIFKPLVTDISEDTAFSMEEYLSQGKDYTNFSILSDNYQRYLLKLGADGKSGIGVHSNAVTLEAQLQRLSEKYKLAYVESANEDGSKNYSKHIIGKLESAAKLGDNYKTIDGARDVADQHGENQNVSTDNINKQIMGKRNENSYTMSVYAYMAHRGFDLSADIVDTGLDDGKGRTKKGKMHIPSLFLNQPIIRDYVELSEKYSSITSEFIADVDQAVLEELAVKYKFSFNPKDATIYDFVRKEDYNIYSAQMTGQALWNNLKPEIAISNPMLQATVLQKFFFLRKESQALSEIQQLLNLSTSKLGVSYFESMQRINTLSNLPGSNFENASKLVGEYFFDYNTSENLAQYIESMENQHWEESRKENPDLDIVENIEEEIERVRNRSSRSMSRDTLIREGYILIKDTWWKPTTIEGKMLINSLKSAQDLMPIFFPYSNYNIYKVLNSIFNNKDADISAKSSSGLKWKYEIMQSFNDFISSNIGMFDGNVDSERRRLFFDNPTNTSLAKIIDTLKKEKNPIVDNPLIKDLQPNIGKEGDPSILVHLSDRNTSFDRTSKYESFLELLTDDVTNLGTFNGEAITPQKLAQDLAAYSFLADSENGATGFRNYIAIPYLETIGVTDSYRGVFNNILTGNEETLLDNFIQQYFQHNPDRAKVLSFTNAEALEFEAISGSLESPSALTEFRLATTSAYVSVRNPGIKTSSKKWNLYKLDESTDTYKKIDVLGTRGFNEYNSNNPNQTTSLLVRKEQLFRKDRLGRRMYMDRDSGNNLLITYAPDVLPSTLGVGGILEKFYNSTLTTPEYKKFINELQEYVNPQVEIEYKVPVGGAYGQYDADNNKIYIHPDIYELALIETNGNFRQASDIVKEVFFEEIIHSMTVNEFNKYVDTKLPNGSVVLKDNAPEFVKRLVALYETAKELVPYNDRDISTYYSKDIYEFMAGMFVSKDYRTNLENKQEGFIERFKKMLRSLFGIFYNNKTGETLKYDQEIFTAIKDLLKTERTPEKGITINKKDNDMLDAYDNILNDKVEIDTDTRRAEPVDMGTLSEYTEAPKQTVTDLQGNVYEVYSDEILTYQTEAGPVRYITDSDGNMIMLKEQTQNSRFRYPEIKCK